MKKGKLTIGGFTIFLLFLTLTFVSVYFIRTHIVNITRDALNDALNEDYDSYYVDKFYRDYQHARTEQDSVINLSFVFFILTLVSWRIDHLEKK